MNEFYYTDERNTQILVSLLKAHGVKKVVASPGATNVHFVSAVQFDPFFEVYSSVDERSAAYMACGLAAESGEPVVLTCTGATASRNYFPGLTEAYYRKLPVLAVTSTRFSGRIGHNMPQVIDRRVVSNDIAKLSVQIPTIKNSEEAWAYTVQMNNAILELTHRGCGPVHINLETTYSGNYTVKELPPARVINRISYFDNMPKLDSAKVAIFVGAHAPWSNELTEAVDSFCEKYNAVVLGDHTSNYKGKYSLDSTVLMCQDLYKPSCANVSLLIHIGDVSGAYLNLKSAEVWRVNPDGALCDTFRHLRYVFEMEEIEFFKRYTSLSSGKKSTKFATECKKESDELLKVIPDLPFSNLWVAQQTISKLPENSVLHLGILNSLRSWNFFPISKSIPVFCNTGGFGIDGCISSLIGAALVNDNKLYVGVVGDLAFFYDMNSIGNRHVGKNVRLIVINNGKGTEFRNYNHLAAVFGEETDTYIAAAGHYGNKSKTLIKHYAEDLGFEYLTASNKQEYMENLTRFVSTENIENPIIFEVFTNSEEESKALEIMRNLKSDSKGVIKKVAKEVLGDSGIKTLKRKMKHLKP